MFKQEAFSQKHLTIRQANASNLWVEKSQTEKLTPEYQIFMFDSLFYISETRRERYTDWEVQKGCQSTSI